MSVLIWAIISISCKSLGTTYCCRNRKGIQLDSNITYDLYGRHLKDEVILNIILVDIGYLVIQKFPKF